MSAKRQIEVEDGIDDEEGPPKKGGLTWWSHAACAVLLLTIAIPLFFDSMVMRFLAIAAGTASAGLALAMIAATIAYFSSGKSRQVMNITATAAALVMTVISVGTVSITHAAAVKIEHERLNRAVDQAASVMGLQWMHEVERSGSARWTHSGDTAEEVFNRVLSEGGSTPAAKLLRACEPTMKQIAAVASKHEEAVTAFHNAGGLGAASLKSKADCDARTAQLKAMGDASSELLVLLRGFYENASKDLEKLDLDENAKSTFMNKVQRDPLLSSAMQVRELDVEYAKHATAYVAYLKAGSGRWSLVKESNTVYIGQGMNIGEFTRLSRLVNDISDRETTLQEEALKSSLAKTTPKGSRPNAMFTGSK